MSKIENALKQLEREEARLLEQRKALELQLKEREQEDKKIEELFQKSGFATPRALVAALVDKYNIRSIGSVSASPDSEKTRRKRTKVTADLRDEVRAKVNGGLSKNKASQEFGISYLVVNKIMDGSYDKL